MLRFHNNRYSIRTATQQIFSLDLENIEAHNAITAILFFLISQEYLIFRQGYQDRDSQ